MPDLFEISPVVRKALKLAGLSADKVLRDALNIKEKGLTLTEGVHFPEGTVLLAWYKNKPIPAVIKNGAIEVEKKTFTSLSGAAAHITGRPTTNGWAFWLVKSPDKKQFVPIDSLRAA